MSRALQMGVVASQGGGGPAPLFFYKDLTGNRASPRTYYDPRTSGYVAQIGDSFRDVTPGDSNDAAAIFTAGSASITANVDGVADDIADSGGGLQFVRTNAFEVTDGIYREGVTWRWTFKLQQDTNETRFPSFGFETGADDASVRINTKTGATYEDGTSALDSIAVTDDGAGYWDVVLTYEVPEGASRVRCMIYPSVSATLTGAADGTVADSVVIKATVIENDDAARLLDNELAILADGSLLIEPPRTCEYLYSQFRSGWAGTVTMQASSLAAPDGGAAYEAVDDSTGANFYVQRYETLTATGHYVSSFFVQKGSVSGAIAVMRFSSGTGTVTNSPIDVQIDLDAGALDTSTAGSPVSASIADAGPDYWRVDVTIDVTATGTVLSRFYPAQVPNLGDSGGGIAETGVVTLAGGLLELAEWPGSPIRTDGAAETRAAEYGVLASASVPSEMLSGRFAFTLTPLMSTAELVAAGSGQTLFAYAGGSGLGRIHLSSTGQLRLRDDSGYKIDTTGLSFSALQTLTVTYDLSAGEVAISGADAGNGTHTGTAPSLSSGDLTVGAKSDGSSNLSAVLGQVFAA